MKVFRKILGLKHTDELTDFDVIRKQMNTQTYMRKRRFKFYGHITMEPSRQGKQILEFYANRSNAKTETVKQISTLKEDASSITQTDIIVITETP